MVEGNDRLYRFLFEEIGVRGEIVSLDSSWQAAFERHHYPKVVADQLGQALAASVLLSATLKFTGSLIFQAQGSGPIKMVVAQATDRRTVRGLARWEGDVPKGGLSQLYGDGQLVMTVRADKGEPYQGVVALSGKDLAEALGNYFTQSEQLRSHFWFAVNDERAVGLMVQELPESNGSRADWERVEMLANTITDRELTGLTPETVIYRLFHEEQVRLYEPEPVSFRCDCSRERIEITLKGMGYDELKPLIDEEGVIEVDCEFCNRKFSFDKVDFEQLFAGQGQTVSAPVGRQ